MKRRLVAAVCVLMLAFALPQAALPQGTGSITITVTVTEAEIIPAIVEFRPKTLRRRTKNIQCYIELPEPYKVENIDVTTVALTEVNGNLVESPLKITGRSRIGDFDRDGIPDLRVTFDIQPLAPLLKPGENTLTVSGNLVGGETFKGTGTVTMA